MSERSLNQRFHVDNVMGTGHAGQTATITQCTDPNCDRSHMVPRWDFERPLGWARPNGAGEIVFRQAGHPKNDEAINAEAPWAGMWKPVYL